VVREVEAPSPTKKDYRWFESSPDYQDWIDMKRSRQRIVKLVTTVDVEMHGWGYQVNHPTLGLVASADTEDEALDKMDKMVVRQIEFGLAHGTLKDVARPAKMGR
jgi:hypothetical protein